MTTVDKGLNTFTSFDAPSRDMCGWSMGNLACNSLTHKHLVYAVRVYSLLVCRWFKRRQMEALSKGIGTS